MKIFTLTITTNRNILKAAAFIPVFMLMFKSSDAQISGPVANFSAANVCLGAPVNFSNSSNFDSQPSFEWSFGDGATDTSANPVHHFTAAGEYNISLKITTDTGVDSIVKKVTIYSLPVPDFNYVKGCTGEAIAFTDSSITSGTNATYSWNFGDGSTSSLKNPTHAYKTASNFLATLKVTSENGCSDFVSKVVTRYEQPVANFVWSEACEGEKLSLYSSSGIAEGSIASLKWEFGDGSTSTSASTEHLFSNAGEYSIKLVAVSDKGCKDSTYRQVTVNPIPKADFSYDKVCEGEEVSFSNLSSTTSGTIMNYSWEFGDGATAAGYLADHKFSSNKDITATLIATSDKGCIGRATKNIDFHAKPAVNFTYSKACIGDSVEFLALPALSEGSVASCSWAFGDGTSAMSLSPRHQYSAKKSYPVTLFVTNTNGCSDSLVKQVQISAPPVSYFTSIGAGYREIALSPVENYAASYDWTFGDGTISSDKNPIHTYNSDSSYNVMLKVTSDEGCSSTHSAVISINTTSVNETVPANKTMSVYPNPYSGNAHINYSVTDVKDVNLSVVDMMGKQVATLVSEKQMSGDYTYDFSASNYGGKSGIYYVILKVGEMVTTTKIIEIQ